MTITGDGNVGNVKHGKAAIYNQGKLTIKGGTFARSSENGTYDPDQANGNSWYTVYNAQNATMNIEDGIFENSGGYSSMLDNWGVLFIEEGVFSGGKNTIKNDDTGVITIDGGNFSNKTQSVLLNWHELTINDGTFTAEDGANDAVINSTWCDTGKTATTNGTIVINGGEFIGDISDFEFSESQLENGNNKGKKENNHQGW